MKLRYKQKLFLYVFVIFALFTAGIVIFEQSRERKQKTEVLKERLDAYANMVNALLVRNHSELSSIDSIIPLLHQLSASR